MLADDSITTCRICGEKFEKFWHEEEEEWMYRNAVFGKYINNTPGKTQKASIFHRHCYKAATKDSKVLSSVQLAPGTPQSPAQNKMSWSSANNDDENVLKQGDAKKPRLA